FRIFDIGESKGDYYIWHEIIGKSGPYEIGSWVLNFVKDKAEMGIKKFVFYSDNCSRQNRNRYIFAMNSYAVAKFGCTITHRFLDKGHTQSEGDSMHALIERNKREKTINTPTQWIMLIKLVKVNGELSNVHGISQNDITDIKSNWNKNADGDAAKCILKLNKAKSKR